MRWLRREPVYAPRKIVFSPYAAGGSGDGASRAAGGDIYAPNGEFVKQPNQHHEPFFFSFQHF